MISGWTPICLVRVCARKSGNFRASNIKSTRLKPRRPSALCSSSSDRRASAPPLGQSIQRFTSSLSQFSRPKVSNCSLPHTCAHASGLAALGSAICPASAHKRSQSFTTATASVCALTPGISRHACREAVLLGAGAGQSCSGPGREGSSGSNGRGDTGGAGTRAAAVPAATGWVMPDAESSCTGSAKGRIADAITHPCCRGSGLLCLRAKIHPSSSWALPTWRISKCSPICTAR
mmetsp:Transcript_144789/g.403451  ORF Transcript_144789/g.403451 Transcript_144789/m.403451 type:complete len:234 (-) Transcript_144789:628-1329(-)